MASNHRSSQQRRKHDRPARTRRFPVSLVMIVRDEEATLGRCLDSVKGLVDEIVVVDTGSSDNTVAIAESHGARIGHFTWVDDFAAARNHALSLATHPWRLVLDADEWIADRERAAAVLDTLRGTLPNFIGRIEMLQVDEETGELRDTVAFPLPRILPRQVGYSGRVHEQVTPELPMADTGLLLGHDGYTRAANERKDGRNIALLEAAINDDPANPYHWFQLGTDHYVRRRYEDALPYLVNAYNILHPTDPQARQWDFRPWWHLVTVRLMLTLIALDRFEEAVALGEQEAETWIESSDFFFVFGSAVRALSHQLISTDKPRADELLTSAIGCWIHAVEQGDKQEYAGALKARGTTLAAQGLVELYELLGRTADAERYRAIVTGAQLPEPALA